MTESINADDVLLGRGGQTNNHTGNKRFRGYVADAQQEYLRARKKEKVLIARRVVSIVKNNGGRFLKRAEGNSDAWVEVTDKRAQEKTSQALREGLDVRNHTTRPSKMARRDMDTTKQQKIIEGKVMAVPGVPRQALVMVNPALMGVASANVHAIPALKEELAQQPPVPFPQHYNRQISKSEVTNACEI